jgi:NADP-dependent 3-hydroxy acid dehydrogenase YdfG
MMYRTALVTGATSGVGLALVRSLALGGFEVYALGRDAGRLEQVEAEMGCHPVAVDLRDLNALRKAIAALEIDVLVNSAGVYSIGNLVDAGPEAVEEQIDVNLRSVIETTRLVLPGMLERGRGHLVNLGSIAGLYRFEAHAAYHAAKAGVHAFTRQLRLDVLGTGVRVTEITPGRIRTEMLTRAMQVELERVEREVYRRRDWLLPEDVVEAIMWAICQPARVNIDRIEILPTIQVPGGVQVGRQPR